MSRPTVAGAGFIPLDMVVSGVSDPRLEREYAGGSCGNVLSILAFLGWNSYPIAEFGDDPRADSIISDFRAFGVHAGFIEKRHECTTPGIALRFEKREGRPSKTISSWIDPFTGETFPKRKPLSVSTASRAALSLPSLSVFYFDRAEHASVMLARHAKSHGAIIYFEPSSSRDTEFFREALILSDIVKYSEDRIPTSLFPNHLDCPHLEIRTIGSRGLLYRIRDTSSAKHSWKHSPSFPSRIVADTTGCGDWCSAGVIASLCSTGRDSFLSMPESSILDGLRFGQALSTLNCEVEGARTSMYTSSAPAILSRVDDILRDSGPIHPPLNTLSITNRGWVLLP